jgi:WD40 repeat protein
MSVQFVYSSDGKFSLVYLADCINWYEIQSGNCLKKFPNEKQLSTLVAYSANNKTFAYTQGNTLHIWDTTTRQQLWQSTEPSGNIIALHYSNDGTEIIIATHMGVKICSVDTQVCTRQFSMPVGATLTTCSYAPDKRNLICGFASGQLRIYDAITGEQKNVLSYHVTTIEKCLYSPDGFMMLSLAADQTLYLMNFRDNVLTKFAGHTAKISAVNFSADGNWLLLGACDGAVILWELATKKHSIIFSDPSQIIRGCTFLENPDLVLISTEKGTQTIWDIRRNNLFSSMSFLPDSKKSTPRSLSPMPAVSARERPLASATLDGSKFFITTHTSQRLPISIMNASNFGKESVRICTYSSDSKRATILLDGCFITYSLAIELRTFTSKPFISSFTRLALVPDQESLLLSQNGNTLYSWHITQKKYLFRMDGHTATITACNVSADSRLGVSIALDKTFKIWQLDTGACLLTVPICEDSMPSVCAFTRDASKVICGFENGQIKIYCRATNIWLAADFSHTAKITGCAAFVGSQLFISSALNGTLNIWNIERGCCLITLFDSENIHSCAVAPDNTSIIWGTSVLKKLLLTHLTKTLSL